MKKGLYLLMLGLLPAAVAGCNSVSSEVPASSNEPVSSEAASSEVVSSEAVSSEEVSSELTTSEVLVLDIPANFTYEEGKLTFDAVTGATSYDVTVKSGDDVVLTRNVTTCEVELFTLELGEYTATVVAKAGSTTSNPAEISFNHKYFKDGTRILEAEDYVSNTAHISVDEYAHGGKYALGFDDCGQGMYFQYYAFEAGERDITVHYSTGAAGSYMNLFVGTSNTPTPVYFNEETGWFGDSRTTAPVTVKATLEAGWNDIYLFKNGNSEDYPSYGGWAQIDYIEIAGTNKVFDGTEISIPDIEEYRFEAEGAKWHWANADQRPNLFDGVGSHGYLGEQNAKGDGVTFEVNMQKDGTYKLILAAGCDAAQRYFDITVNGETQNRNVKMGNAWNVIGEDDGFLVHLNAGANVIDFSRGDNGNWSCIDYLKIKYVSAEAPSLAAPTNLSFEDNTLTFDAVEDADSYRVTLIKDEETLLDRVIEGTSLEIPSTIHGENIGANVYAKCGFFTGTEPATLVINPGVVLDKDVKLEAEDYILGERHYSADPLASAGGYGLDFDNCGEGMYFRYYAYEAGSRKVTIAYATGMANSKMDLRVNHGVAVTAVFPENTGWFGDSHVFATVEVTIDITKGWNHLDLYKMGTGSDDPAWGGYAQIDYIIIEGSGKSFDTTELTDLVCDTYILEAESGNYTMAQGTPGADGTNFSGYYLGNQDNEGNGVVYKFKVDVAGTYKITFYCGGEGTRNVGMKVNDTAITSPDSEVYTLVTGNGWNVVGPDTGFNAELTEGWNTIQLSRLSNEQGGGWICIDYCVVSLVK